MTAIPQHSTKDTSAPEDAPQSTISGEQNPDEKVRRTAVAPYVLLALVVGILSFGLYYQNTATNKNVKPTSTPTITPLFLSFASPNTDTTSVNGEILISGKTMPGTTLMAYSDIDESIVESNEFGEFETSLIVADEGGPVRVTAVYETGEEKTETFVIQPKDVLGEKSNSIKVKTVQKEDKPVPPRPTKSQVVNDVEAFLSVKTKNNKAEKLGAAKIKELTSTESTGSSAMKSALKLAKMEAKIASGATALKRHAISGVITAVSSESITIAHLIQRERTYTIYTNIDTVVTSKDNVHTIDSLALGMRIAAVGTPIEDGLLAKRIHVIPGLATGVFTKNPVATISATPSVSSTPSATPISSSSATPTQTLTPTPTL